MVRIVSWNVNGLRTLKPSVKAALDSLDADIICLQETKISSSDVNLEQVALVQGYNSFFSFCKVRSGYAGVATYVRASGQETDEVVSEDGILDSTSHSVNVTPLDAGEGFCNSVGGVSVDWAEYESTGDCLAVGLEDVGHRAPIPADELALMRDEGRIVITDHKRFVLVNIYAPAVSVEGRYAFKLAFNRALELKMRAFRSAGRHVIVAGDFNLVPNVRDRAENVPNVVEFNARPHRAWFRDIVCEELGFVDTFREMHATARNAYTCWSEATRARETNFGSRIDLVIVNKSLYLTDVIGASILRDVLGSDHCPIAIDVRPGPLLEAELPVMPPPFCSRFLKRFTAKQASMRSFLVRKEAVLGRNRFREEQLRCPSGSDPPRSLRLASSARGRLPRLEVPRKVGQKRAKSRQQLRIGMFFEQSSGVPSAPSSVDLPKPPPGSMEQESFARTPSPPVLTECSTHAGDMSKRLTSPDPLSSPIYNEGTSQIEDQRVTKAWRKLLCGPPAPPLCRHHEPCKLKAVKKAGENKGRTFYSCNRPAGQWPADQEANCNYFEWAPWTSGTTMIPK